VGVIAVVQVPKAGAPLAMASCRFDVYSYPGKKQCFVAHLQVLLSKC